MRGIFPLGKFYKMSTSFPRWLGRQDFAWREGSYGTPRASLSSPSRPLSCHCHHLHKRLLCSLWTMPGESPKKRSVSGSAISSSSSPLKKAKGDGDTIMAPIVVSEGVEKVLVEKVLVGKEVGVAQATNEKLYFAKMSDKAHVPTKGSKVAAGYDLKSAYKYTVPARGSALVKTDIQIKLPSGYYGRVAPRSGLALKNKIDVGAGVIDEDYRGNVGVILFNHADVDFEVNEGDRVAQLICEKICYPELVELENLDETERGEGGFGSTGVTEQKSA